MPETPFDATPNEATGRLAAAHAVGLPATLSLRAGEGELFGDEFPLRVVAVPRTNLAAGDRLIDPAIFTVYRVADRDGDDLTIDAVLEGTADRALGIGSLVVVAVTGGLLKQFRDAIHAAEGRLDDAEDTATALESSKADRAGPNTFTAAQTLTRGLRLGFDPGTPGVAGGPDQRATVDNLWRPRRYDFDTSLDQDYQDELALADHWADAIGLTPTPGAGAAANLFVDDSSFALWASGTTPWPIVLTVDLSTTPVTAKNNPFYTLRLTTRGGGHQVTSVLLELWDTTAGTWVATETGTVQHDAGGGTLAPGLPTLAEWAAKRVTAPTGSDSGVPKLRLTLGGSGALSADLILQRVQLQHPSAEWDPWHLRRDGGESWGDYRFNGAVSVGSLEVDPPGLAGTLAGVDLLLTELLFATEGRTTDIFFANAILAPFPAEQYGFLVRCVRTGAVSLGKQLRRKWTFTPTLADVGDWDWTLEVSWGGAVVASRTVTLRVRPAALVGSPVTRRLFYLGDSRAHWGTIHAELANLSGFNGNSPTAGGSASALTLDLTGVHSHAGTEEDPFPLDAEENARDVRHDAWAGWSIEALYGSATLPNGAGANPYWDPALNGGVGGFSFNKYLLDTGFYVGAALGWFALDLGVNGPLFGAGSDAAALAIISGNLDRYEAIATDVHGQFGTMRVAIVTTVGPGGPDGFGLVYGTSYSRERYARSNKLWVRKQIDRFDGRRGEGIYVWPAHLCLDTENDYPTGTLARGTYDSATDPVQVDAIHPADRGSYRVADSHWQVLRSWEV